MILHLLSCHIALLLQT